jgi:hypothetical protein
LDYVDGSEDNPEDDAYHAWAIDPLNGKLQTSFGTRVSSNKNGRSGRKAFRREGGFLRPGHVLTMKVDCTELKLSFFRDGGLYGSLPLPRGLMQGMQFFAYMPVVGFDIVIVPDPECNVIDLTFTGSSDDEGSDDGFEDATY